MFLRTTASDVSRTMKPFWTRTIGLFIVVLFSLVLFGCGENKPDGLPKLQPVTLRFTLDGQPCDSASVHLIPQENSPWVVGGSTDTTGTVVLKTHGKFSGVPIGKYKITVSKVEREDVGELPKNMYDPQPETVMYNSIDPDYSNPEKTSLEIDVIQGKKISESFDLGKKIRVKIEKPKY
ncbi:MAG: hypothetical protein LBC74_02220 [Planctomycetaceae bacterium]|jgi:hypothetical protein|nr:hypothetical protein [Planctomycetaceae bacterium]